MTGAAAASLPVWVQALSPLFAVVMVGLAFLPFWRKSQKRRNKHEARIEATCDVVLGLEADPNVGRMERMLGLSQLVPQLAKTIGVVNGSGKTVMEHVESIDNRLSVVEKTAGVSSVEFHMHRDTVAS